MLHADDNGNGGAFALYAQLKRALNRAVVTRAAATNTATSIGAESHATDAHPALRAAPLPSDIGLAPEDDQPKASCLRVQLKPTGWRTRVQVQTLLHV